MHCNVFDTKEKKKCQKKSEIPSRVNYDELISLKYSYLKVKHIFSELNKKAFKFQTKH